MQAMIEFQFDSKQPLRVLDRDGETWFALADVCSALDIANIGNAAARLDEDEKINIRNPDVNPDVTPSRGNPNITIISEAGLYSLILSSRKSKAKAFKRWVTHEVLPTLRRTGEYRSGARCVAGHVMGFLHNQQLRVLHAVKSLVDADGFSAIGEISELTGLTEHKVRRALCLFEALGLMQWCGADQILLLDPLFKQSSDSALSLGLDPGLYESHD